MSDCCCSSKCETSLPDKHRCPVNVVEYPEVPKSTITHHIKPAWDCDGNVHQNYFCYDQDSDGVYFGMDDSVIVRSQVRTVVGEKESSDDAMLCYCYGSTMADALKEKGIRDFDIEKTKVGDCSCETSNPSGTCCLKYFPRTRQ